MSKPSPAFRPFDIRVLQDKSATDVAQVPAAATIDFYRQGATVASNTTVAIAPATTPVPVYDTGTIVAGDTVRVGGTATTLVVASVPSRTSVVLQGGGSPVSVPAGTRLIRIASRPDAYSDPMLTVALGSTINTAPGSGRTGAFLREGVYDYVVSGAGIPSPRVFPDASMGGTVPSPFWVNTNDFPTIQAAIDALPDAGGVVYIPSGLHVIGDGLLIDKPNVTLQGDGVFYKDGSYSSVIQPSAYDLFTLVTVKRPGFRMRNILLIGLGPGASLGTHDGLAINGIGVSGNDVFDCSLENVSVHGAPRHGIHLQDVSRFVATNYELLYNGGEGFRAVGLQPARSHSIRVLSGQTSFNNGRGAFVSGVARASFIASTFESNRGGPGVDEGNALQGEDSPAMQVLGCYFEDSPNDEPPAQTEQYILLNGCDGAVVESSTCFPGLDPPKRVARLKSARGMRFTNNMEAGPGEPQDVNSIEMLWLEAATASVVFGNIAKNLPPKIQITGSSAPTLSRNTATVIATDFESIAAAVAALPALGGTVYIPEGTYDNTSTTKFTSPLELPENSAVRLLGAGPGSTILQASSTAEGAEDLIRLRSDHQSVEALSVVGLGLVTGRAVVVGRITGRDTVTGHPVRYSAVRNCEIRDAGDTGVYAVGSGEGDAAELGMLREVFIDGIAGGSSTAGVRLGPGCDGWTLRDLTSRSVAGTHHLLIDGARGTTVSDGRFIAPVNASFIATVQLHDVSTARFARCDFRCEHSIITTPFVVLEGDSQAVAFDQCTFESTGLIYWDIEVSSGATIQDLRLTNPRFKKVDPEMIAVEVKVHDGESSVAIFGGTVRVVIDPNEPESDVVLPARVDQGAFGGNLMTPGIGMRLRLPALTSTDISVLPEPRVGDVVYDRSTNQIKFCSVAGPPAVWLALEVE